MEDIRYTTTIFTHSLTTGLWAGLGCTMLRIDGVGLVASLLFRVSFLSSSSLCFLAPAIVIAFT